MNEEYPPEETEHSQFVSNVVKSAIQRKPGHENIGRVFAGPEFTYVEMADGTVIRWGTPLELQDALQAGKIEPGGFWLEVPEPRVNPRQKMVNQKPEPALG